MSFTITDARGREIAPTDKVRSTPGGLRPFDVLILDCGAIYGRYLPLVGGEWDYPLKKGRYRLRARIESTLGSFGRSRPDFVDRFQRDTKLPPDIVKQLFRDFTTESEAVLFEVRR